MTTLINNEDNNKNNLIKLREVGVNTEELDPEELRKLVENNIELRTDDVGNMNEEVTKVKTKKRKIDSIKSLTEKE